MQEGGLMVYVNQEQLDQIEYLISKSIDGQHLLFQQREILDAFSVPEERYFCAPSDDEEAQGLIEQMFIQPSLREKRLFLEALPEFMRIRIIRCYFDIIEHSILERDLPTH